MRARWLHLNPRLRILGIEIDPARVAEALPYAEPPGITFALGGFNVADLTGPAAVRLIRCYNVLRQYDEGDVRGALQSMCAALEPGGLLIEGTSNPSGRIVAFDVYQKTDGVLSHVALVFGSNFRAPAAPVDFQTILPKRLIHHAQDQRPAAFFDDWRRAFALARGTGKPRREWVVAAELLRTRFGWPVDARPRLLRRGFVALRDPLRGPLFDQER